MIVSKKKLTVLLMFVLILTPLVSFAETELSEEEQMLYDQFSLMEAPKPVILKYPFGYQLDFVNDGEAMERIEDWWRAKYEKQQTVVPYLNKIQSFTQDSAQIILANGGDLNNVYSPINTWFYLELLTKLTEENSQAQVLRLLDMSVEAESSIDNEALYKALYWDDGLSICRPASSLWINQCTHLSDVLLQRLAAKNYTSVYQGTMGDEIFNDAYRSWLNEQTNHIMADIVADLGFDKDTSISLCTTLYMRCLWSLPFNQDETISDVFYGHDEITTTDFMRKEEAGGTVYRGTDFSSVIMDLQDGGYVTFVLPDSDIYIGDVIRSDELFDFLFAGREWTNRHNGRIKISMPKMDIFTAVPLREMLMGMGVTDVFDSDKVVFSKEITSEDDLKISSIEQYSRMIMNEDGVEAASMIVSDAALLRIPYEDEIDFILNRPFMFAVFSEANIPLFIGVYNAP